MTTILTNFTDKIKDKIKDLDSNYYYIIIIEVILGYNIFKRVFCSPLLR